MNVILRAFRTVDHVQHERFRPSDVPDRFLAFLFEDGQERSSQNAVTIWNEWWKKFTAQN
jgi:hypothetical protein